MHVLENGFVALTTQRRQATYAVLYRNQNDQFHFTRTGLWQLMTWLTLRPGHYRLMYWLFRPTSPCFNMMTSSNGNTISVTGHLCEEFTSHRWIPIKGQWRRALMFSLICVWINGWVNSGEDVDLRRNRAHYNVIVMISTDINYIELQIITWLIYWLVPRVWDAGSGSESIPEFDTLPRRRLVVPLKQGTVRYIASRAVYSPTCADGYIGRKGLITSEVTC